MFVSKEISIVSHNRNELIDITDQVKRFIAEQKLKDGFVTIFVPHTTAAVTINENADPDVKTDLLFSLDKISPIHREFKHLEGNSDAHVKTSLIGNHELIPVINGTIILGVWQGIYFCEFDGPRTRKTILTLSG